MAKHKQKSLRTIRIEQSVAAEILMDFMFTKSMSVQTKTKPTTLYAIKHKQSGRLVTGTDFRYSPHRQILSDYQSPLLFTVYNLLHEIQHRQVSLRYYTVVGVTVQEV